MTGPGEPEWPDEIDEAILAGLKDIYDEIDPMPSQLDDLVILALATTDELDAELARIVEDELVRPAARAAGRVRTIQFEADGLHLLVTVTEAPTGQVRIDGWLAEADAAAVELRTPVAGAAPPGVVVDETGRFAFEVVARGPAQFVVRRPGGTVVTPVVQL